MRSSTREENTEFNRSEFFARLASLKPESVLDVGCGSGDILRRCELAGIEATGVEPGPDLELTSGLNVIDSEAETLPFDDSSFDWVTMRFVPHHLREPALAFAEAIRVCRSGFLVAEPWFDASLASQRTALALDGWVKRQHRRSGMVHEAVLPADELIRALPGAGEGDYEIQVDKAMRLRTWTLEDVDEEVRPHLEALPAEHQDRIEFAGLRNYIERDGITWNGSVFLIVRCY